MGIKLTRVTNVLYRVLLSKHWFFLFFFFLGFIVLFELTDSESEPLGKQGCTMQQTPRRAFPAPAPQQVTVFRGGAEIWATRQHTGLTTSQLDPCYHSKLLHVGLRATSPILHLSWSSQVDLRVLGHTTDRNAWQNIRKSEYYHIALARVRFILSVLTAQARWLRAVGKPSPQRACDGGDTPYSHHYRIRCPLDQKCFTSHRVQFCGENKKAERKFGLDPLKAGDHL